MECRIEILNIPAVEKLRTNPTEMRSANIARVFDSEAQLENLLTLINDLSEEVDAVILPAVFGLSSVYPLEYIRKYLIRVRRDRRVQLIGPAPESISKIQDLYRQVLYVKGPDKKALIRIREKLEKYIEINSGFKNVYIQYDFNA